MDEILKNATQKQGKALEAFIKAKADLDYWQRFVTDYTAMKGSVSNVYRSEGQPAPKYLLLNPDEEQEKIEHSRNKVADKYQHLPIASMSKCIELTKSLINELGAIKSTTKLLELFAEKGYTVKPHTLAAYLSQAKDFEFNRENGGWNLKEEPLA